MALEERTRPHQTSINYNPDGSFYVTHRHVYEVVKDGNVITQSISEPETLDPNDDAVAETLAALMGDTAAAALAQSKQVAEDLETARQAETDAKAELTAANQQLEAMRARAEAAEAKLAAISQTIAANEAAAIEASA